MTINEANKNRIEFHEIKNPTEDDKFIFIESMEFLIKNTNDTKYMAELAGFYYAMQDFDLAIKYYEMSALQDFPPAYMGLGYIWYYGRTGVKDYKKAFENYEKAMKHGDPIATYKIADMYKNGYYVEKDYEKYKTIIIDLYLNHKNDISVFSIVPEIYTRMANIYIEEGNNDKACKLLLEAKQVLAERISLNGFFGNFTIMEMLIKNLYKIQKIDSKNFDFYDLYYLLESPNTVLFDYEDETYEVESCIEDGFIVVRFNDVWFKTISDFMKKAEIGNTELSSIYYYLENFRIKE